MTKHEPWHQNPVNLREVLDDQPGFVARCVDRVDADRIVHEHNLFPDLLEACRVVMASLRIDHGNIADIHKLEAVITKAEGR